VFKVRLGFEHETGHYVSPLQRFEEFSDCEWECVYS